VDFRAKPGQPAILVPELDLDQLQVHKEWSGAIDDANVNTAYLHQCSEMCRLSGAGNDKAGRKLRGPESENLHSSRRQCITQS
jgi:hypothetical protein